MSEDVNAASVWKITEVNPKKRDHVVGLLTTHSPLSITNARELFDTGGGEVVCKLQIVQMLRQHGCAMERIGGVK